jgi:hypothetical protein
VNHWVLDDLEQHGAVVPTLHVFVQQFVLIRFFYLQDSPVFNFINNLSPIPTHKPQDSHNVQLFKSLDLAPVSSIFASPHVNPPKESKLLIR